MYKLDKEEVRGILIKEMGYSKRNANLLLQDFPPLPEQLTGAVRKWLNDRTVTEIVVDGISLQEVMDNQQVDFLVAVRELNKLLDPSIPLDKRENLKKILQEPVFFE